MREEFRKSDIEGYWVSDQGRVMSIKRRGERILSTTTTKGGFVMVCVYENKRIKSKYVARMVLSAFKGYPADPWLCVVKHKDGNLSNCRLENLEWVVCETTDEYDASKSKKRGVLKPDFTKEKMSSAKYMQSEDTIRKGAETRRRNYEQRRAKKGTAENL